MENVIRRLFAFFLFIIVLFSPIVFFEIIIYGLRWIFTRKRFPKNPLSFEIIERLW
jgi:hypothetical protein